MTICLKQNHSFCNDDAQLLVEFQTDVVVILLLLQQHELVGDVIGSRQFLLDFFLTALNNKVFVTVNG